MAFRAMPIRGSKIARSHPLLCHPAPDAICVRSAWINRTSPSRVATTSFSLRAALQRPRQACCSAFGPQKGDEGDGQSGLCIGHLRITFVKEVHIGPVAAVLHTGK